MFRLRIILLGLLWPMAGYAAPEKLSGIGDSITQAFAANGSLGDRPEYSWAQGTQGTVNSVYLRYRAAYPSLTQEFVSVSGAEMVGGSDNAAAQAGRICRMAKKPNRVVLELGGNDVCNRGRNTAADPTANMYSVTTYRNALKAALDQLGACLPAGSVVQVMSMPRVDYLREAGIEKRSFYCPVVWSLAGICRIVTAESDAGRRRQIGARIDAYNDGLRQEVQDAARRFAGRVRFLTDWQGASLPSTSVGTYRFTGADINGSDCFHPYHSTGQKKLACTAWESGELGQPANIQKSCLK